MAEARTFGKRYVVLWAIVSRVHRVPATVLLGGFRSSADLQAAYQHADGHRGRFGTGFIEGLGLARSRLRRRPAAGGLVLYVGDKLVEIVDPHLDVRGTTFEALAPSPTVGLLVTLADAMRFVVERRLKELGVPYSNSTSFPKG